MAKAGRVFDAAFNKAVGGTAVAPRGTDEKTQAALGRLTKTAARKLITALVGPCMADPPHGSYRQPGPAHRGCDHRSGSPTVHHGGRPADAPSSTARNGPVPTNRTRTSREG